MTVPYTIALMNDHPSQKAGKADSVSMSWRHMIVFQSDKWTHLRDIFIVRLLHGMLAPNDTFVISVCWHQAFGTISKTEVNGYPPEH